MDRHVSDLKSLFTIKNIIRILSLICIIFVFCPFFLVSCSGQSVDVSVMNTMVGITYGGEKVTDPHPLLIVCLLLPIAIFVILFIKRFSEQKTAAIILGCSVIDTVVLFAFRSSVKEYAESNYCSFETTAWFVINIVILVIIALLSVTVILKILNLENGTQTSYEQESDESRSLKIDKTQGKYIVMVGGILAVIFVTVWIVNGVKNSKKIVNLDDFIKIETSGYDGYGEVDISIDWLEVGKKYGSKLTYTRKAKKEKGAFVGGSTPMDVLRAAVSVEPNSASNLSNGDVVSYIWKIDERLYETVNCKIKCKDGEYKVSGLSEIETFDAFADLTVEYTGVSPEGEAKLNYTGSSINYYDFMCDKKSGLKNGDIVTVSISTGTVSWCRERLGKIPVETQKQYRVEGLESYVTRLDEIDSEALDKMLQQASDVYNAYAAKEWDDGTTLESFSYLGNYMLTPKEKSIWRDQNNLYLVFRAKVRNYFSNNNKTYNKVSDEYWYVCFSDLKVSEDGKVSVDITRYSTAYDEFKIDSGISDGWWTKTWYLNGYSSLSELYKEVVTSNVDVYNHEDNVDESLASNVEVLEDKGTENEMAEKAEVKEYILPNSDKILITKEDLNGLTANDCVIARNEIFARHGRKFVDEELKAHFETCSWYEGTVEPEEFDASVLSDIEISNNNLIVEYEKEMGY